MTLFRQSSITEVHPSWHQCLQCEDLVALSSFSPGWVVMDLSSKSSAIMNDCSKRNYNYDQDNKCAANSMHAGSFGLLWLGFFGT